MEQKNDHLERYLQTWTEQCNIRNFALIERKVI